MVTSLLEAFWCSYSMPEKLSMALEATPTMMLPNPAAGGLLSPRFISKRPSHGQCWAQSNLSGHKLHWPFMPVQLPSLHRTLLKPTGIIYSQEIMEQWLERLEADCSKALPGGVVVADVSWKSWPLPSFCFQKRLVATWKHYIKG